MIVCNSRQASLGATKMKEQSVKTFGELSNDKGQPQNQEDLKPHCLH
jgi:hypothetical protein